MCWAACPPSRSPISAGSRSEAASWRARSGSPTSSSRRASRRCPLLSERMAEVGKPARHLGPDFHLVSISVDPERDTPARLAEYGARYGANPIAWSFLTGPEQAIQATVVDGFKVGAGKERSPGRGRRPRLLGDLPRREPGAGRSPAPHSRLLPRDGRGPRQADGRRRPRRQRRLTRRAAPVSTSAMSNRHCGSGSRSWRGLGSRSACQKQSAARAPAPRPPPPAPPPRPPRRCAWPHRQRDHRRHREADRDAARDGADQAPGRPVLRARRR